MLQRLKPLLVASWIVGFGWPSLCPAGQTERIWWSPLLALRDLGGIGARLAQPFDEPLPEVRSGAHAQSTDCISLLALRAKGFTGQGDWGFAQERSLGSRCVALTLLRHARRPSSSGFADFRLTAESVNVLPPTLALGFSDIDAAAARRAEAQGKSWLAYQPGLAAEMQDRTLVVKSGTSVVKVRVYACADFTGDGRQEILVATEEAVSDGTYRNTGLFLLARADGQAAIRTQRRLQ